MVTAIVASMVRSIRLLLTWGKRFVITTVLLGYEFAANRCEWGS